MWRALLYSILAHVALAGAFRGVVYLRENPFDAEEAQLEFTVGLVQNRPAQTKSPRRKPNPNAASSSAESAAESDSAPSGEEYIPVGRTGRGPRWLSGHITRADYPPEAEREGIETTVRALVYIRKDGTVYRVRILKGHSAFHELVLRKLRAALFSPAIDAKSGRPIAVRLIIPIQFKLR